MKRKNIWREAAVLFVAALMVVTVVPAAALVLADNGNEQPHERILATAKQAGVPPRPDYNPNIVQLPNAGPVKISQNGKGIELSDVWLGYAGAPQDAVGLTSPGTWETAIRLTPDELGPYGDYELDTVKVYHGWPSGSAAAIDVTVIIYAEGTDTEPGSVITTQTYSIPEGSGWVEIPLSTPVPIDPTHDLWVSIEWQQTTSPDYPAGCDAGPMVPNKGGFIRISGDSWHQIAEYGIDVNWEIQAGLSEAWAPPSEGCDFAVEINSPRGMVNSMPKVINISYYNYGPVPINEAKILADVYKEIPGPTSTAMYDDMEGNVSLNWAVVDNGDGDSWTISDKRAHSGNHSFRCTAGADRGPGEPDTYLGHAADSGPDELILAVPANLDGAEYGILSFWDWCQGEYYVDDEGYIVPTDYGTIAISNDNGATWYYVSPSDFVAYQNDWRQTKIGLGPNFPDYKRNEVNFVVPIELTDQMVIKFIWTSDPHVNYEGWYIDDVKFERTEPPSYQLVWQGHLKVNVSGQEYEGVYAEFPLEWTPEENVVYRIDVCGQVFDPANCDVNPDNNCDTSWVIIKNIHDVAAMDITGPERIERGEDGTYEVTIKNVGTYPEAGFPVNLEVRRQLADIDQQGFEDGGSDWVVYYIPGSNTTVHITTCDAYEGTHSLLFATDNCEFPVVKPYSFQAAVYDKVIDLSGDNVKGGILEFAAKWALSEQIGSSIQEPLPPVDPLGDVGFYDFWSIILMDPDNPGWIFFAAPGAGYGSVVIGHNDGKWGSPTEPGAYPGAYTLDLIQVMDQIHARYDAFFKEHKCKVGFALVTNDDEYILNGEVKTFSGLFIDDVRIIKTYCENEGVVVDTKTAPYLNPGDEATLTFTWANVSTYCDYCVCGVTALDTDESPENDTVCTYTRVTSTWTNITWETADLTATGQESMWHIVSKKTKAGEPPEDQYWWCGNDTLGTYVEWMDDSLILKPLDLSGYVGYDGIILTFDTYYDIKSGDYGAVYWSTDGTHWNQVAVYTGFANWHQESVLIPPEAIASNFQIKFRFFSDGYEEGNGWYIDDINISVFPPSGGPLFADDFSGGISSWTVDPDHPDNWDISYTSNAGGASPELEFSWAPSFVGTAWIQSPAFNASGFIGAKGSFKLYIDDYSGDYVVGVDASKDGVTWTTVWAYYNPGGNVGPTTIQFTIPGELCGETTYIRFFFSGDSFNVDYFYIDDVEITGLLTPVNVFFDDVEHGADNWDTEWFVGGDWWHLTDNRYYDCPNSDNDGKAWWCGDEDLGTYPSHKIDDALYVELDLTEDAIGQDYLSADIEYATWYDLAGGYYYDMWSNTYNWVYMAQGYVEISTDYGLTWHTLRTYRLTSDGWIYEKINLDRYIPNHIILRFRFTNMGADYAPVDWVGEGWYIDCFELHFKKQIFKDETPPVTSICVDGNKVYLSAYDPTVPDQLVSGLKEIYYRVDGGATQIYWSAVDPDNATGPFTVPEGRHTVEYWSVDFAGNEETHHTRDVIVDTTPPTVEITRPEAGTLYLFDNKIMKRIFSNVTLCIGKITIAADVSDATSGIDRVEFTIDNVTIADYTPPYEYTYSKRAFGMKTVTVKAVDKAGNEATASTKFMIFCLGLL